MKAGRSQWLPEVVHNLTTYFPDLLTVPPWPILPTGGRSRIDRFRSS
jgi:hypothetical protein